MVVEVVALVVAIVDADAEGAGLLALAGADGAMSVERFERGCGQCRPGEGDRHGEGDKTEQMHGSLQVRGRSFPEAPERWAPEPRDQRGCGLLFVVENAGDAQLHKLLQIEIV